MLRILTVDDHEILRRGVKEITSEFPGGAMVGEARNGAEALQLVTAQNWDLVVLDIALEGRSGLDVLKELKQLRPQLPVLIFSMHSEKEYAKRAYKGGAAGYLTKGSSRAELVKAIQKVIQGGKYISAAYAEELLLDLTDETNRPAHERLSDRELEVLKLIASGKSVTQIADELSLDKNTISTHRRRILEKMGLATSAELIRYALKSGLVD